MAAINFKDEALVRIYAILAVIVMPVAVLLAYRTVDIAYLKRAEFLAMGESLFRVRTVQAERGNIYSNDENLLATSVPYFSLHFDPFVASPKAYYSNIDSLAYLLSVHVNSDYTPGAWRDSLIAMRDSINRPARHYYKIAESVSYSKLQQVQRFPIFNEGRLGGGLIVEKRDERKRPFGWLARRTIGKVDGEQMVGIEDAFNTDLAGTSGQAEMFQIPGGGWIPTENLAIVEPTSGADVYTTLDVNIQDIAENALDKAMHQHLPEWGSVVVMDVETGAIRAMANLGRNTDGSDYFEMYNYAIAMATEPGSTFKLATMMALLEDDKVTLDSEIDIENGTKEFYDVTIEDSNPMSKHWNVISVRQAFEQSSNVAMAKLADSLYSDNEFSDRLKSFHLEEKTGLELEGEAQPFINSTGSGTWSGVSRAWLAFGYESKLTPLQTLTFFNAVANNGRMMKPYLVKEVRREGKVIKAFKPTVIDKKIASQGTIEQLRSLLEGVVDRGTAYRLKSDQYRFAGKTGTSLQNYGKPGRRKEYQASFAGYFPADNPKYSVIVVIYNPSRGGYYGSELAGPVFREIADNIYNSMIEVHEPLNQGPRPVLYASQLPNRDAGHLGEIAKVLDFVNVHIDVDSLPATELAVVDAGDERVDIKPWNPATQKFPNVRGMRLRDAVYVLENEGYIVHPQGVGRVVDQKWQTDGRGQRGRDVTLILN
ncbi:penicillin-binding transpeptidase domain-containing protein [Neolewinella lacunae]|uniref:penicillin-binding transpeptidase domain-containing protein n=1 Tax=Neolewinella lacunae TaxID=1517758 RepID=UPI001CA4403B|nr:penicillin-binding transpeptidase domain-containing protein [Neolewinella lacunae]MDN3634206.1 penicillin-binding transpeptidase domain-containing protein [Neolewinella lacunae]